MKDKRKSSAPTSAKSSAGAAPGAPGGAGQPVKQTAVTPQQLATRGARKPVNLALQGGGAHGAFTWGVLDRLLEDDRLALDAISATSAGAMNAVVMAYGVSQDGRRGARDLLEQFWRQISEAGQQWSPIRLTPWDKALAASDMSAGPSFSYMMFDAMTHALSPYQLNPLNINPLRDVLNQVVDFEKLALCPNATRLFISATNVLTGKIKVFENSEMSADVVMASACLPYVFKAVQIGADHYWDGGFMGNPAIFPLIYKGASNDVVVVHVNPLSRDLLPRTAAEIADRVNEITFNSSLMREMRAIAFVSRLVSEQSVDSGRYSRMHVHAIRNEVEMRRLSPESKLEPDWNFLTRLRDIGRDTASQWLEDTFEHIGKSTTIDLADMYL